MTYECWLESPTKAKGKFYLKKTMVNVTQS